MSSWLDPSILIPAIVGLVTVFGSGALVKVITERQLRKAETRKTLTEGEVSRAAEDREWVKAEREEARQRIAQAEERVAAANQRADALDIQVDTLQQRVTELETQLRDMRFQLAYCPGGALCPMRTPTTT